MPVEEESWKPMLGKIINSSKCDLLLTKFEGANSNLFQIGINLHARGQPILIAHFTGEKLESTNYNLLKSLAKNLFLTLKVILAIHYEALKLFFKGMSFKKKPEAPKLQICYIKNNDTN